MGKKSNKFNKKWFFILTIVSNAIYKATYPEHQLEVIYSPQASNNANPLHRELMRAFGGIPLFSYYGHDYNAKIAQYFVKEPEEIVMFIEDNMQLL